MQISGRQALAGGSLFTIAVLVSAFVGASYLADTTGNQQPDQIQSFEGEFSQIGLVHSDLEDPFKSMNGFETITEDDSADSNDELTDAEFNWTVSGGTDLGLEERTAVLYHQVEDGALEDVDYELTNPNTSEFDSVSGEVYNYESAVDSGELGRAIVELDVDEDDYSADTDRSVALREGEYALVIDYKFDSDATAPSAGNNNKLHDVAIMGDSDEDDSVETITGVPVAVTGN